MYFIKITSSTTPTNTLQKYLFEQLKKLECLTIENPDELKKHLEKLTLRANITYKRCTPVKAFLNPAYVKGDYSAGISMVMQFSLYAKQGEFVSLEEQRQASSQAQQGDQTALFPFQPSAS